jgi:hypothetical protein
LHPAILLAATFVRDGDDGAAAVAAEATIHARPAVEQVAAISVLPAVSRGRQ